MKRLLGASVPLGAALVAFVLGSLMILALGENPISGASAIIEGAFGSGDRVAVTAVRATPLLLVGIGITIAFRASVINIGGEGQIIAGALLSTAVALAIPDTPRALLLPIVMIAGMIGGGIWGAIPGALKAYASVNEILSTVMLNIVAVQLMNFLLRGPMIDPIEKTGSRIPQTERLSDNAAMPSLAEGTRLHLGVVIAVVAAIVVYIILWRTPLGFRLRAVGHNPDAARAAGISVEKNITTAMAMSGALSGLAGVMLVSCWCLVAKACAWSPTAAQLDSPGRQGSTASSPLCSVGFIHYGQSHHRSSSAHCSPAPPSCNRHCRSRLRLR